MSRLRAGLKSSQMPDPVSTGFQFLFRKLSYRFVKLAEHRGFVIRQCSRDGYRVGNMMAEQIDADVKSVDKRAHLYEALDFRFLYICPVRHLLI